MFPPHNALTTTHAPFFSALNPKISAALVCAVTIGTRKCFLSIPSKDGERSPGGARALWARHFFICITPQVDPLFSLPCAIFKICLQYAVRVSRTPHLPRQRG